MAPRGGLPTVKVTTIRPREDTGTVYVADLKIGQLERIERKVGLPIHAWRSSPSWIDVLRTVAIEVQGGTDDDYAGMTYQELSGMVLFNRPDGQEDEDGEAEEEWGPADPNG